MSGHNKWSSIKHKKAKTDAIKGKQFTKAAKEIIVAVKEGGADADANSRLRLAIENAKKVNMPQDNIKRAIQRADKSGEDSNMEEIILEGYAPLGVAVLVNAMTDNRNRTLPEIRNAFNKSGGNMGESGCVSWMFHKKGYITISDKKTSEDDIFELVLDAGAEDISTGNDGSIEITTSVESFYPVKKALEDSGIELDTVELTYLPDTTVPINDVDSAKKILKTIERLEDVEDVQNVYANFDIPDEILEGLE